MRPHIYVADPGLKRASGHHAGALATLSAPAGTNGLSFFGHADPDESLKGLVRQLEVSFQAFFQTCFYDGFERDWSVFESQSYVNSLVDDYVRLFHRLEPESEAGVMFHHTMDWPHLLALASALSMPDAPGRSLRHCVFLMFNPGVDYRGNVLMPRRYLGYRMALSLLSRDPRVRMFAACRELSGIYRSILNLPNELEVHPCFFFNAGGVADPLSERGAQSPSSRNRVLLYFGDAKAEKGFCELPDLCRSFLRFARTGSEIVIHYNLNDSLSSEPLARAAETLRRIAQEDARFKLITEFLLESELIELVKRSSCVVFNYSPLAYANKTSGLLWLACSAAAPVAVIGESWLSREAPRISSLVRVLDRVMNLEEELKRNGRIRFEPGSIDVAYRESLFRPIGEFLRDEFGMKAKGSVAASPSRQDRNARPRRVLFVDHALSEPNASAGGRAAWNEMALFQALGYAVSFVRLDSCIVGAQALEEFRSRNVEMLNGPDCPDALAAIEKLGAGFDVVYITRFHVAEALVKAIREHAPGSKIILNVADLHFLREARRAAVLRDDETERSARHIRRRELAVLSAVDLVLTYTDVEQALIQSNLNGQIPVARCPWIEEVYQPALPYHIRRDLAFLGGYAHAPNVDAVVWFVEEVMPRVKEELPGVRFRVYGANVPPALERYANEDVVIDGFVSDVSEAFDSCRVFVAPLRYGAGLKGKVAAALARGLPCVLSPVAAEGFFTGPHPAAMIAGTPEEWVNAISELYHDKAAWAAASQAALDYSDTHFRFDDGVKHMAEALKLLHV